MDSETERLAGKKKEGNVKKKDKIRIILKTKLNRLKNLYKGVALRNRMPSLARHEMNA